MRTTMRTRSLVASLAIGGMLIAATGCGKASEKIAEKATEKAIEAGAGGDADVDIKDGGYTVETDEGSASFGAGMPSGWPDDVPLPDDFAPTGGANISSGADTMITATGTSGESIDDLLAFYDAELTGWEQAQSIETTVERRMVNRTYTKDDRTVSLGVADNDENREITFTYMVEGNTP